MPLHHDENGERRLELELVVPGTPEQVWQAVATGPGNSAWFTTTEIDETVGGTVRFDFGPNGSSAGEVTAWEPPVRFGYVERDWSGDAPPVFTEITVTGRSGNECVIRMVHSLFTDADDWDDEIEGFESGWTGHFAVLRIYLAHFAGLPAAIFEAMAPAAGATPSQAWATLTGNFGLHAANVGDSRPLPGGADAVVEQIHQDHRQRHLLVRLTEPAATVVFVLHTHGDQTVTGVNAFFYGDDAARHASDARAAWQPLLQDALP